MTTTTRTVRDLLTDTPGLRVASRGEPMSIHVDGAESRAVHTAVDNLTSDLADSCGALPTITSEAASARVVVGTVGCSPAVDDAVAAGVLDLAPLLDTDGQLRWEGHLACVVGDALFLVGADRRGTVYAVYDFTRAIGVSPWRWWADVPVRTRDHVTVATNAVAADHPSVRYRGIFINDEEELDAWARLHTGDGTIGPETYARVCELILRLKGNYLWPAMHVGAFNHDPANGRVADELGIVVGTSHCDMLLRSNEHEFGPWAAAQDEPVEYDYSLPGRNRELVQEYWRGSVEQNRDHEVTWTVGMRGIHDYGFQTTAIDEDATLGPEEKFRAKVALLGRVIADQRDLLASTLGVAPSEAPQLFIPYKEVLPLYDAGLEVPDDVTMVWANDNFGHVRRLPDARERRRTGGHGLYYHCSYWSDLTTSYLATSSTPLALMGSELRRAWEGGVERLWVLNIGGVKPLEHELEYFLALAWEAGREVRTADVDSFTAAWIDEWFSGGHGPEVATIHGEYSQINQQRKLEHLDGDAFCQVGHGDEAGRRLASLRALDRRAAAVLEALPSNERDAFFQLVVVKVHLAHLMAGQFYHADRSRLALDQGKSTAADHHLALSRAHDDAIGALVHHYNHGMARGRWSGIFTPRTFPPPVMPLYPAAAPALRIGAPGLGVVVWGEQAPSQHPRLEFHPHGTATKWIEVFTTGAPGLEYTIEADPWIEVGRTRGTVEVEDRIQVHIPDPLAAAGSTGTVRVMSPGTGEAVDVLVAVAAVPELPEGFDGVVEADGHVTIDPSLPDDLDETAWVTVPRLGRYANAALRARPAREESPVDGTDGRTAVFHLHLETPGAHLLELHRLPTLDSTGRIRIGISVDDHPPVTLESPTTDEHRGVWKQAIRDNVEVLRLHLPALEAGAHTLRLHAVDPHVTLSKLVLHTADPVPSNLGPEFSAHTRRPRRDVPDPDPVAVAVSDVVDDARRLHGTDPATVAPLDQVYAGDGFWEGPTTFRHNTVVPQPPGPRRFTVAPDGTKDVPAELGSGVVIEANGTIAFEAENVLAEDTSAWTTPAIGQPRADWSPTQSETNGRTGLAMHVLPRGLSWDPVTAPGLHQRIRVATAGRYRVWLLAKYDDHTDDACVVALDGHVQPPTEQFCGGHLATYGTRQVWVWALLSELDVAAGDHTFSLFALSSGLRVDRVHLTLGDGLPPVDAEWIPSPRL